MQRLAGMVDPPITKQAISKYESGQRMPSSSVLVGLSKALDVTLDFLTSSQVTAIEKVEFRKRSHATASERAQAEAILIDWMERCLAIEHVFNMSQPSDAIQEISFECVMDEAQIEGKAEELRDKWQLGMGPLSSICGVLENKGIRVLESDLPATLKVLSCSVRGRDHTVSDTVMVSRQSSVERRRFTLAIELAHRVILSADDRTKEVNKQRARFAGAFLVPRACLHKEVGERRSRITYYEVLDLKCLFGVSAATILDRLRQVGLLPEAEIRHAYSSFAKTWRRAEPKPINANGWLATNERPRRLERLVLRALGERLIQPVRAAELLKQSLASVEQMIRGPSRYDDHDPC